MNDGTCACGTCHCPGYDEAMAYADQGCMSLFLARRNEDGPYLSYAAYEPTIQQRQVMLHRDQQIRAAGHCALAVNISRDMR